MPNAADLGRRGNILGRVIDKSRDELRVLRRDGADVRREIAPQVGVPETHRNTQTDIPLAPNSSGREASSPRYQRKPSQATQEGAAVRRESVLEEHVRPASRQTGVAEGTC